MKAVHFGAGNIGRGFLGQLYTESGFETTFVDVVQPVIDALNRRGRYTVRIVEEVSHDVEVANVRAVNSAALDAVAAAVAEADIVSTAVGVNVLGRVAGPMAAGIARRLADPEARPLDVILCENLLHASDFMREKVREQLDPALHEAFDRRVGFVEASIGRMVPKMTPEQRREDPLLVCVEAYCELPVDAAAFRGPIPPIAHLAPKANFEAYVERKLFVHNCGHATAAYLGYLRGQEYVWQAMQDAWVRPWVDGAMEETCLGLHRRHGLDLEELREHAEDLKRRFQNKALGDQVARVGADPWRKLGPQDRLVGALTMCLGEGVRPEHVAAAVAAAARYDAPADKAALRVAEIRERSGLAGVLRAVCGLDPESEGGRLILAQDAALAERP